MTSDTRQETLAELLEADAPPHIQSIYGEIRRLGAVPMVALIYRHLATIPGVLEVAWRELAPLFRSGMPQEAAWQIADAIELDPSRILTSGELRAAGIGPTELESVISVLEAYSRANPLNMMGVAILLARWRDPRTKAVPFSTQAWDPPESIGPLPAMTAPALMTHEVLGLVSALSPASAEGETRAVPSLYRHFAQWPGLLKLCRSVVEQQLAIGEIDREAARLRQQLEDAADQLARHLSPLPQSEEWSRAVSALNRFTGLIPEMTVIGTVLRRALPAS